MTTQLGLNLLRLAPVISSTSNFIFAIDEYTFLDCWVQPEYRDRANGLLPPWFTAWMRRVVYTLIAGFSMSFATGIANVCVDSNKLAASGARGWYILGIAFTLAHFVFGPKALGLLRDISEDRPKGNSTFSMKAWLRMHRFRTLAVDMPAWVCFTVGAALVFTE